MGNVRSEALDSLNSNSNLDLNEEARGAAEQVKLSLELSSEL
jgi:hypothetical protein